jgi:hypothetical protein
MEDCRLARQVAEWNPQGKRRRGRHGRMEVGTAYREETLRMKNVSIVSSGG